MAVQTLEEFIATYGNPDKPPPVFEPGPEAAQWPTILVKAGDKAAIVQFMNVGADSDGQHLCIDVHAFVAGRTARASVFGMESGRRLEGFADTDAAGTSHGVPAARLVAVLIGAQTETGGQ
ncbi:hypothetical protein [Phytohabitans houttuyneae]|uniref:Uncharacterized protein n=1 Tax=Phytohabitans houttuyneae TaxID=1076126 RepID=A0A6V8KWB7_9ACTN|nr:hypothetical protein [Phytohabitans houttuyneae]GFJ84865.1 hypothetical protein Phou_090450 [Phytohabitans houttuyneae]